MGNYNKMPDAQFRQFTENFVNVAEANAEALGLSIGAIAQLENAQIAFGDALTAQVNAIDAAKAATSLKRQQKCAMLDLVRLYANQWQANPTISDELKQQLGLPIHDKSPTPRSVFPPSDLYVRAISSGTNWLRWDRNENFPQTVFEIQCSYDVPNNWQWIEVTMKTDFRHTGQTPGRTVFYRVRANRPTGVSAWSNIGVAYGQSPSSELSIAEAA